MALANEKDLHSPPEDPTAGSEAWHAAQLADHEKAASEDSGSIQSVDSAPDGGYGWVNVGVCFSINCFTWGAVASYGVYLAHYLKTNGYAGASSLDYGIIGGLNTAVAMLVAPLVTILARLYGPRVPMVMGVIFQSAGFTGASFARSIWQLYLCQGALIGLGVGFIYIPSTAILSQWFSKKRSLASGISTAGSGIGGIIFSFASGAMISSMSVAWSLRVTGIITGIMNLTAAMLIRHRNEVIKPPQRGFDKKLLRRYDVMLLLGWAFISTFGYIVLFFSLPDFALSIKLSSGQAAAVSAFLNLGTAIGRPLVGVTSDRFGRIEVAGTMTLACGISVFAMWIPATSYGLTIFFAIINGAILGVFWVTIGPLAVEVAGLVELPSLLSLAWMSVILPATFAEVIALKLRRPNSSRPYLFTQIFVGLAYVIASFCLFELRRVKRRGSMPSRPPAT
ncbi:MAG: hypothetical protein M1817_005747 [Caeruleum heppii]|nr:MAG: hypothetical protein M1817_005747 [Caeruleum heppii]